MNLIHNRRMIKDNPEIMSLLAKYGALFAYIIIGLAGIFGLDLVSGRKISVWYIIGTSGMAVFAGWLAWRFCASHPSLDPGITVPVITLCSRDILIILKMINWRSIFSKVLRIEVKEGKKDE